jgi:hypothetical protein
MRKAKYSLCLKDSVLILLLFLIPNVFFVKGLSIPIEHNTNNIKLTTIFNIFSSENLKKGFFVYSIDFKVSDGGEIFFIDSKTKRVLKYSKDGVFIKYIGRIGQGPGEYIMPTKLFVSKTGVYIYDSVSRKIHHYDTNDNFKKTINIGKLFGFYSDFFVSGKGEVLSICQEYKGSEILKVIGRIKGDRVMEIIKILKRIKLVKGPVLGGISHSYTPKLFMRTGKQGFYFSYNMESKIYFYDIKKNKIEDRINLKYLRENINSREKDFFENWVGKEEMKKLPKYKPYYENMFVDSKNNVYLLRTSSVLIPFNKRDRKIDKYDLKGNFLYTITLQKNTIPLYIDGKYIYVRRERNSEFYISKVLIKKNS